MSDRGTATSQLERYLVAELEARGYTHTRGRMRHGDAFAHVLERGKSRVEVSSEGHLLWWLSPDVRADPHTLIGEYEPSETDRLYADLPFDREPVER